MGTPSRLSRYRFCTALKQVDGTVSLSDREPYAFRNFEDNRRHMVVEGDNLWGLASIFFDADGIDNPSSLYWIIADFQPEPVFDPTVKLEIGRLMHIPSMRTVFEEIFSENRRTEHL